MDEPQPLRRLPWTSDDERPAYLSGSPHGPLSRLADAVEARQVQSATQVLAFATPLLAYGRATPPEAAWMARRLAECLRDVLAVAESRGVRLGIVDGDAELH